MQLPILIAGAVQYQQRLSFVGFAHGDADIQLTQPRGHVPRNRERNTQSAYGSVAFHSRPNQSAQRPRIFRAQVLELLYGQLRRAMNLLTMYDHARGFMLPSGSMQLRADRSSQEPSFDHLLPALRFSCLPDKRQSLRVPSRNCPPGTGSSAH